MFDTPALTKLFYAIPESDQHLRFVGGCVRDSILSIPCEDIDLCTPYSPQEIIRFLQAAHIKYVPTGIEHGTVMAVIDGRGYEITTLRKDIDTDGRRATVEFTKSYKEDAARRDLTFNALSRDRSGKIYDYCGGLEDLQNGVVRFIGDPNDRIQEDFLRILRYFRFYARFAKTKPDAQTLDALSHHAHNLKTISSERIQSEFLRLLATKNITETINLCEICGVLSPSFSIPVTTDLLKSLFQIETEIDCISPPLLRLLALSNLQDTVVTTIQERLKLSRKDAKWMDTVYTLIYSFNAEPMVVHLYNQDKDMIKSAYMMLCARDQTSPDRQIIQEIDQFIHKPFPITGQDLINEGFQPGADLGKELKRRERDWILKTWV